MAQMNVSIPEKLKGWAEQRVAEGRYSSTSDYIRDLVRRDQENVVMVAESEWEGLQETLHLLASPANAKHLLEGIAELDAGHGEEHELIER